MQFGSWQGCCVSARLPKRASLARIRIPNNMTHQPDAPLRDLPGIEAIAQVKCNDAPGAIDLQYAVVSSPLRRVVRASGKPKPDAIIDTPLRDTPEFSESASSISDHLMYRQGN